MNLKLLWDNLHRSISQTPSKYLKVNLQLAPPVFLRYERQSSVPFVWMCGHRYFLKYSFYVCYEVILDRIFSLSCWNDKPINPKFICWKYASQVHASKIRLSGKMGSLMKNIKINEAGVVQIISVDHAYFNPTCCVFEDF